MVFDDRRSLVLFADPEGVVEFLDLRSGRSGMLLRPPELLSVLRLEMLSDGSSLVVSAFKPTLRTKSRPPELRVWNYPALLEAAGLAS